MYVIISILFLLQASVSEANDDGSSNSDTGVDDISTDKVLLILLLLLYSHCVSSKCIAITVGCDRRQGDVLLRV